MENSTTYIADLPPQENITYQLGGGGGNGGGNNIPSIFPPPIKIEKGKGELINTSYAPMDIHPNPYLGGTAGGMGNGMGGGGQLPPYPEVSSLKPQPQYPLPSRDIYQNTAEFSHDEQIHANYIPKPKLTHDFVRRDLTDEDIKTHRQKKKRQELVDDFLNEFQIPLFVALLFFLSQMSWIKETLYTFAFRYFPILFDSSGGFMNQYGMVFQSLLFGAAYYAVMKGSVYLAEE